jgi:2-polyprenyl-3-methyl-5-hydroxy-6-metoxy-1,4-benzoquinol methylase
MARKWCDRVHTCFLQDADFNAGSFDVVYSGEVVEHVPYEDADAFIAAYARVLKPGGVAILTTPNPNYIRLWLTGRKVTDDPSHFSEWSVTNLRRLVEKHGLKFRLAQGTGRMARKLGTALPVSPFYGSYMLVAEKP